MSERQNFFEFPHKAFRHMWMDVVAVIGRTNPTLDSALAAMEAKVTFACDSYAHHNKDESEGIAPRLRELDAALTTRWLSDHDGHLGVMEDLKRRARSIRATADLDERAKELRALYRFICRFLAEDLVHMELEQEQIMGVFQKAYDDDQLRSIEAQFIKERIDPAYLRSLTPLFLEAGNVDDRTFLLSIMQKQVPAPVLEELFSSLVTRVVPAEEVAQLRSRLALS